MKSRELHVQQLIDSNVPADAIELFRKHIGERVNVPEKLPAAVGKCIEAHHAYFAKHVLDEADQPEFKDICHRAAQSLENRKEIAWKELTAPSDTFWMADVAFSKIAAELADEFRATCAQAWCRLYVNAGEKA